MREIERSMSNLHFSSCLRAFVVKSFFAPLAIIITSSLALIGCQSAQVAQPLTVKLSGNDADSQLEFWHELAERRVTSNDEAFHGLLLYLDNKDSSATYADRVLALKSRHLLLNSFSAPAGQAVTRGNLAYAILHVLQIKGGLILHVFGPTPRYALRELEFEGIYPPSSDYQTF